MDSPSDKLHRRFPYSLPRQNSIGTGYEVNYTIHEKSWLEHTTSEMQRDSVETVHISRMEVEVVDSRNRNTSEKENFYKRKDHIMEKQDRKEVNSENKKSVWNGKTLLTQKIQGDICQWTDQIKEISLRQFEQRAPTKRITTDASEDCWGIIQNSILTGEEKALATDEWGHFWHLKSSNQ
ncbi:MAG: hypothetical protein EZS28_039517 [Streblomastix strix]|uniref:Uncharacterized protein n=1 Tax=Streblomastix strix TaxID=222440 RepID=A0A5J4U2Z7_9EUKA|nr:MAG: hypothetical protein EZS28_039517 [Streblomastix strix]